MKCMITYAGKPAHMPDAVARFLQTGGLPPNGVKLLGRWHSAGKGFVLADVKDDKACFEWLANWTDTLELTVHPVVEDRDAAAIYKRVYKGRL